MLKVAAPLLSGTVPSVAFPSLNATVPVGVPLPEVGKTVAVKVTDWPNVDGLSDDATAVEVAAGLTVCVIDGDVLAAA